MNVLGTPRFTPPPAPASVRLPYDLPDPSRPLSTVLSPIAFEAKAAGGWLSDAFTWVRNKALQLFQGVSTATDFTTRAVVWDPSDVNAPSAAELDAADRQRRVNAPAEARTIAALPADRRASYAKLQAACAGAPLSAAALQAMLLDGRLTPPLLDALVRLHDAPKAPGIDARALVADVLAECEEPTRVNQHAKGTCGATTAQIYLLRQDPAAYVRIVTDLASPAGAAKLAGGKTVRREADWASDTDGYRSLSSRLFQPAMMELGNTFALDYDNARDKHKLLGLEVGSGLLNGGLAAILEQTTGRAFDAQLLTRWGRDGKWAAAKQFLAAGRGSLPVSLTWGTGGHFVQVDKVANGVVSYTNPWGQAETMAEAEFFSHLTGIVMPR